MTSCTHVPWLFFGLWFFGCFPSPTAKMLATILPHNTTKDAGQHKHVPFWSRKTILKILTHFYPQNYQFTKHP